MGELPCLPPFFTGPCGPGPLHQRGVAGDSQGDFSIRVLTWGFSFMAMAEVQCLCKEERQDPQGERQDFCGLGWIGSLDQGWSQVGGVTNCGTDRKGTIPWRRVKKPVPNHWLTSGTSFRNPSGIKTPVPEKKKKTTRWCTSLASLPSGKLTY